MENNSDKIIREKLAGLQPPFEPQAWQQMEAMLNKNEKPKGFLFWWLGGMALLLATGMVLYAVFTMDNEQLSMNNEQTTINNEQVTVNNQTSASEKTTPGSNRDNSPQSTENNSPTTPDSYRDQKQETKNENQLTNYNEQSSTEKTIDLGQQTTNDKPKTKNQKLTTYGNNNKETASRKSSSGMSKSKNAAVAKSTNNIASDNAADITALNTTTVNETPNAFHDNTTAEVSAATVAGNNIAVNENTLVAASDTTASSEETTAEQETIVAEAVTPAEDSISTKEEKQPEETVEKIMKSANKFHYSLGVASTLTATVTKGTLAPRPSYSIGFVNEFLFVNRVALSMGFNYSKTSYMMYDPNIELSTIMPLELKANITELTIPLGVKAYPVSTDKFRYYVSTGVINHIKLQENFVYMLPAPDTSTNPNLPQTNNDPVFNYVPQTTYFGSTASEALFDTNNIGGGGSTSSISNSDFSLNNAQRFYMSFYAATGVEFVIKKRLVIFAETLYFTNIHPLGVQDTRKHNFGMGSGIRVQF